jgi:hypothetical protein
VSCDPHGVENHSIIQRGDTRRIEGVSASGHHWLLWTVYAMKKAALARLERLNALAKAHMPEQAAPGDRQRTIGV